MSYNDMCRNFTDLEMCSVSIDALYEDGGGESVCVCVCVCVCAVICPLDTSLPPSYSVS